VTFCHSSFKPCTRWYVASWNLYRFWITCPLRVAKQGGREFRM